MWRDSRSILMVLRVERKTHLSALASNNCTGLYMKTLKESSNMHSCFTLWKRNNELMAFACYLDKHVVIFWFIKTQLFLYETSLI